MKNRKGFTLIELLIVIAIIGILAVAFVPTLLDAPSRGRDSQRVANLNTIRTVLLDADLRAEGMPVAPTCIGTDASFDPFLAEFGGTIPTDPSGHDLVVMNTTCQTYYYLPDPAGDGSYSFGLYSKMETEGAGNVSCAELTGVPSPTVLTEQPANDDDSCYAILVQ